MNFLVRATMKGVLSTTEVKLYRTHTGAFPGPLSFSEPFLREVGCSIDSPLELPSSGFPERGSHSTFLISSSMMLYTS